MPVTHRSLFLFLYGIRGTPLGTSKLAFTRITNQRKSRTCIDVNTLDRAGVDTHRASITFILIQAYPVFPGQSVMRAGRHALMVFTGQAHSDDRHFGPVNLHIDAGLFGGIFAKVGPRANGHANLTFSAKRALYFEHLKSPIFRNNWALLVIGY
jgi:hypothetical protein